jgi:universal stress protein E
MSTNMSTNKSTKPLNVVIGTTFDGTSDEVVATGARVAAALGAKLHLVHAYEVPLPLNGAPFMPVVHEIPPGEIERSCRDSMDGQIARLQLAGGAAIVRHVEPGPAHRAICEVAAYEHADLVVVGANDTFAAHALGSTASRVSRKAACPVLVLRGELSLPPRRVLLPVDLSPISGETVIWGLELLERLGCMPDRARGHAGSAVEALYVAVPGSQGFPPNFDLPDTRQAGEARLEAFLVTAAGARWGIEAHCGFGGAREEVLKHIAATRPDLVVLGTHGRSGFERLMLGSVAEGVVAGSPSSVLVVPPLAGRAAAAPATETAVKPAA